jgi:shikimate kinase
MISIILHSPALGLYRLAILNNLKGEVSMFDNYVLIGLPYCGKTTLGQHAARELGLPHYDTDQLVRAYCEDDGFWFSPSRFCEYQSRVFMNLVNTASNSIISTGGSALNFDRDKAMLRDMGHIIYIDRDPEILMKNNVSRFVIEEVFPANDKPPVNLATASIKSHMDLPYKDFADYTVENNGGEEEGVANLLRVIHQIAASGVKIGQTQGGKKWPDIRG